MRAGPVRPRRRRRFARTRRLLGDPLGLSGLVLVAVFFASALFAPWLTPHSPSKINVKHRFEGPSATFLLGTDQLGRDTLTRVLYGGRVALQVAAIAVSIGLFTGLVLGMLAGYGPRWMDNSGPRPRIGWPRSGRFHRMPSRLDASDTHMRSTSVS